MRFNKNVEEILNKQINAEFWSAYLYLSMSAYFESKNLPGFANWMKVQYQEEMSHAIKIFDYIHSRGGAVKLQPIAKVETEWKSPVDAFKDTYKHECEVTDMIHKCYEVALKEKDHATTNMLQWFIDEQVEEEDNAQRILDQLELIGDNGHGIFYLDKEMSARTFVDMTKQ
ncbi:MAG: ferritin [Bacteroidales bacterium]|nr:ferritin [Bacteroidales bacterium]MDD3990044.1 ferritin [Bacteroidales bacterium]MDD4639289.1 ferritin [Bacteroidales bacterium]